jgi:histidyl-tRNA synthetase
LFVGEDEVKTGTFKLKDQKTGEQIPVARAEIAKRAAPTKP